MIIILSVRFITTITENENIEMEEIPNEIVSTNIYDFPSSENIHNLIKNAFYKYITQIPLKGIYKTIYNKSVCVDKNLKPLMFSSLNQTATYLENKINVEKIISKELINVNNSKNMKGIEPILSKLTDQIKDVKLATSEETLGYLAKGIEFNLDEMINKINSEIDTLIQSVNESQPIDNSNINTIITNGNNNVVTQIMKVPIPVVTGRSTTASDESQKIMNGVKYTDSNTATNEINTEAQEYINTLNNEFAQLLNEINTIFETEANDILTLINEILDYQKNGAEEKILKLKNDALVNVKSIIDKNKSFLSGEITKIYQGSNNDFGNYFTNIIENMKYLAAEIFGKCKKNEYLALKEIMSDRIVRVVKVVLNIIIHNEGNN
ncbi:hypothetical protein DMUE_3428 [Dictyocoela muelleri]|nr:hypothetical protein DMUE_3428 [Dictyocoela muelleri]